MSFVFEWHPAKAASNLAKHGVGFEEAATVLADPLARIFDDPDHSRVEDREIIVGHSAAQRLLVLCGETGSNSDYQRQKSDEARASRL